MTTKEMIKFLIETEYINYSEDYKLIDEIVVQLKDYDDLRLRLQDVKFPVLGKIR